MIDEKIASIGSLSNQHKTSAYDVQCCTV